jgi:NAD(P)-dependent dehydrogenase (short-subunit alcohol dehydrogenase family)
MKQEPLMVIVTGGNAGIGFYTIQHFLKLGATVVMASRSQTKAETAIQLLKKDQPKGKVLFMPLDLMKLSSVRTFAQQFKKDFDRLDVLVNNAGIMLGQYQLSEDGFESQMATNHFGHFALTGLLMSLLVASKGRIVNVSSIAHRRGDLDFDNLHYQQPKTYSPWGAYSRSKLANLLFTYELDRQVKANHIPVSVIAAHPGVSKTQLLIKDKPNFLSKLIKFLMPIQSAKRGAIPIIEAATNLTIKSGSYLGPSGWFEMSGHKAKLVQSNRVSHDVALAKKLFEISSTLTGVSFFKSSL